MPDKEEIVKKGWVEVRVKVGGRMQVHKLELVWEETGFGYVTYLESRFPIPPVELIRIANELGFPVMYKSSKAFPKNTTAKDFAVREIPETEEDDESDVAEEEINDIGIEAKIKSDTTSEEEKLEENKEAELDMDPETRLQIESAEKEIAAIRAAEEADREIATEIPAIKTNYNECKNGKNDGDHETEAETDDENRKKKKSIFDALGSLTEDLIKKN